MIIRRIEIVNFRKLQARVVIDAIAGGLVVLAGHNEEGKSTLLSALRAAFFYKYKWSGSLIDGFMPFGSRVRPEIVVDFDWNGEAYRLSKGFCQQPFAKLTCKGREFDGDAAEEELAKLLAGPAGGRAPRSDAQLEVGPFGMVWALQGAAWNAAVSDSGRAGLQQALADEVGNVLGGTRAKDLLGRVRADREALLSRVRNEPTGELKRLQQEHAGLVARREQLQTSLAGLEAKREALAENERRRREQQELAPVYRERLEKLRQQEVAGEALRNARAQAASEVKRAEADAETCRLRLQRLRDVASRVGPLQAEKEQRDVRAAEAAQEEARAQIDLDHTTAQAIAANERLKVADEDLGKIKMQRELAQCDAERHAAEAVLRQARGVADELRRHHTAAAAILVDQKRIQKLRVLHSKLESARATLAAVSTQVEIEVAAGNSLTVGGRAVGSRVQVEISETTQFAISGIAEIRVKPGASVTSPRSASELADTNWREAAADAQVADLADAEAQFQTRSEALHQAELLQRNLDQIAPAGVDGAELNLEAFNRRLLQLQTSGAGPALAPEDLGADLVRAESERELAQQAARDAASAHRSALMQAENAKERRRTTEQEAETATAKLTAARAAAADLALEQPEDALLEELAKAESAHGQLQSQLDAAERELIAFDGERHRRELEMAERANGELQKDLGKLSDTCLELRTELRKPSADGQELDEVEQNLQWVSERLAELSLRAKALKLLVETLEDAERIAEAKFLTPITQRVAQYLPQLIPGSAIQLDSDINVNGLDRNGRVEPFDSLSHGTREQLAILVRLAFADLLRAKNKPALVVIDDAPVYADDERFGRMLGILHEAAKGNQILILTCRESQFRPSGAQILHLSQTLEHASHAGAT